MVPSRVDLPKAKKEEVERKTIRNVLKEYQNDDEDEPKTANLKEVRQNLEAERKKFREQNDVSQEQQFRDTKKVKKKHNRK